MDFSNWLQQVIVSDGLAAPADNDKNISRAIIDDRVLVVYDTDDVPDWLQLILALRDDEGNIDNGE